MLLIRTDHDSATHYLFEACHEVIEEAKRKGFQPLCIESKEITLTTIQKRVKKSHPRFFFFNGHGSDSSVFDNKGKELIARKDADVFSETIAFTRSCSCLQKLGEEAVNQGCRSFIGYRRSFYISHLDSYATRPLKDPAAKPVLETSNLVALSLIRGKTVGESIEASKRKSAEYIRDLSYSNDPYLSATLPALINNVAALGFCGDEGASLNVSK